jgi:CRP-like cAMP-binding protein
LPNWPITHEKSLPFLLHFKRLQLMNAANLFNHEPNTVELATGEYLFREGDRGECMYVLLEGTMNVIIADKVVEHSVRGALLGEMALIGHTLRGASVVATELSRLAKVDEKRFNTIIQSNPFFAKHVMTVLADRLRHTNQLYSGVETKDSAPEA